MTTTINIDMDAPCTVCGKGGASPNGMCLSCTADAITGTSAVRTFKKIKVDVSTKYLELVYTETVSRDDETFNHDHHVTFKQEVHADMVQAMANFIPHLAVLVELLDKQLLDGCEMIPFDRYSVDGLAAFDVSSISTGGEDEHFGVTISGRKRLRSGKVFNINAPFTKFVGGEHEEAYALADYLREAYDLLVKEVSLFLDEGKAAPSKQTKLEFDEAA